MKMRTIWKLFSFAVILLYIFLGIYLLVSPRFEGFPKQFRVIFAIFLFLYAGWRIARIFNAERERKEEERERERE